MGWMRIHWKRRKKTEGIPETVEMQFETGLIDPPNRALFLDVSYLSKLLALWWFLCSILFFCSVWVLLTASVDLNRINWAQLTHGKLTNHEAITKARRECLFWMCHMRVHPLAASTVKNGTNTANQHPVLSLTFLTSPLCKSIRGWSVGGRLLSSSISLHRI